MREKCERGRGSVNVAAARANVIRREAADGFVGEGERRGGNINADGAGAEVFAGDGCSQGTSFVPMAAISRRGQGGRIYNNTRTREPLRRKCVKPAAPTTHSPSKTCSRPRTTTRPARAFSHSLPAHFRSPRSADARLPTSQHIPRRRSAPAPAQRRALPEHFLTPSPRRRTPAGCAMHSSPPSQHIPRRRPPLAPAQRRALPGHFLTPFPRTSAPPPRDDARPPPSPPIPRQKPSPVPAQRHALPAHFRSPTQAARCILRRPHDPFPAEDLRPSPQRHAASPSVLLRAQKKRHRTVDVRCRMSRSTVVAVGHWGW